MAHNIEKIKEERTPDKLFARGKAFAQVGDLTRAEQYLAAALEAGLDEQVVVPLLLRVCIGAKRYRVALDYAEPLLQKHPSDAPLRFVVASIYSLMGEPDTAEDHLEQVVQQNPNDAAPHFALAILLRGRPGGRQKADLHFREYLRLEPKGVHAEEARASLLKELP